MNFTVDRKINNNVFSIDISFESYGSEEFTSGSEEDLLKKYGCPIVNIGHEPHVAKLIYDEEKETAVVDGSGEDMLLVLNSRMFPVNEKFKVSYSIDANTIKESDTTEMFDTALKIAEAKCVLFEHSMIERITESLNAIKSKMSSFEKGYPDEITI